MAGKRDLGELFLEKFDQFIHDGQRLADKARDGLGYAGDALRSTVYVVRLHSDVATLARKARAALKFTGR